MGRPWVLVLLAGLFVEQSVGVVEGQYSAFSGLVVSVLMGVPEQQVRVSLDFTRSAMSVFHPNGCPPFVPFCFQPEASRSLEPDWAFPRTAAELVKFDNILSRISVKTKFSRHPNWLARSEVAGSVGLVPSSALFANELLSFRSRSRERPHSVILSTGEAVSGGIQIPSASEDEWRFRAFVGTRSVNAILDLSEQDLVLPFMVRAEFTLPGHFEVHQGRLFVQCSALAALDLELGLAEAGGEERTRVRLTAHSLLLPGSGGTLCATRIRCSFSIEVVLGRPFLESVNRLTLDFSNRSLFVFRGIDTPTRLPVMTWPVPLIPVFTEPVVRTDESGAVEVSFDASGDHNGLVLLELLPSASAWKFARTRPASANFGRIEVPGALAPGGFTFEEGVLRLLFAVPGAEEGMAGSLRIERSSDYITLVLTPIVNPELSVSDLALPPPHTHSSVANAEECAICLTELAQGERVQRMASCTHAFHQQCIARWLERNSRRTCPICRSVVSRRVAPLPQNDIVVVVPDNNHCCRIS